MTPAELVGQRFGRLECLALVGTAGGRRVWHWRCDCGTEFDQNANAIQGGRKISCGCQMRKAQAGLNERIAPETRHGRRKDLMGQQFGTLTAVAMLPQRRRGNVLWYCVCECGSEIAVTSDALLSGNRTACGRHRNKSGRVHDLTGQVFGRLTAIAPATARAPGGDMVWYAVCSCGGEKWVPARFLKDGRVVSCGCRWAECKVENFRQASARRSLNKRGPWSCLFGTPYIRPRKGRRVNLMGDGNE